MKGHRFEWYFDTWYKMTWGMCYDCSWVYPENDLDSGIPGWLGRHAARYHQMVVEKDRVTPEKPMPF